MSTHRGTRNAHSQSRLDHSLANWLRQVSLHTLHMMTQLFISFHNRIQYRHLVPPYKCQVYQNKNILFEELDECGAYVHTIQTKPNYNILRWIYSNVHSVHLHLFISKIENKYLKTLWFTKNKVENYQENSVTQVKLKTFGDWNFAIVCKLKNGSFIWKKASGIIPRF